jgi:hypothetical protein
VESDWQSRAFAELDLEVWKQNRALLASALAEEAWTEVASAFEILDSLKGEGWPGKAGGGDLVTRSWPAGAWSHPG